MSDTVFLSLIIVGCLSLTGFLLVLLVFMVPRPPRPTPPRLPASSNRKAAR